MTPTPEQRKKITGEFIVILTHSTRYTHNQICDILNLCKGCYLFTDMQYCTNCMDANMRNEDPVTNLWSPTFIQDLSVNDSDEFPGAVLPPPEYFEERDGVCMDDTGDICETPEREPTIKVLEQIPPNANPFHHDSELMGEKLFKDYHLMYQHHTAEDGQWVMVIQRSTGKRIKIQLDQLFDLIQPDSLHYTAVDMGRCTGG